MNQRRKTLSYKGNLKGLLEYQNITYTKRKSEYEGLYNYTFKSSYGITWKVRGTIQDFRNFAKQFIQMELVGMGDKAELYVVGAYRATVTVNK